MISEHDLDVLAAEYRKWLYSTNEDRGAMKMNDLFERMFLMTSFFKSDYATRRQSEMFWRNEANRANQELLRLETNQGMQE